MDGVDGPPRDFHRNNTPDLAKFAGKPNTRSASCRAQFKNWNSSPTGAPECSEGQVLARDIYADSEVLQGPPS